MKKILILALCCMTFMTLNAQEGWEKIINNGEIHNRAVDFWEAPNGNFIVVYNLTEQVDGSEEFENVEIHLAHLDQDGAIISDNVIPNGGFVGHQALDLLALDNGNLLISGATIESISIPANSFVMEVTTDAQIIWEENYDIGSIAKIIDTGDGNFFLSGTDFNDDFSTISVYAMGISATGDSLWTTNPVDYPENVYFTDAILNSDGNIYLCSWVATTVEENYVQGVVSTVDASGTLISQVTINPEEEEDSYLYKPDFIPLPLGGFAMVTAHRLGSSSLQPDYERFMVYKYNENIELEWATEIDSIPIDDFETNIHIGHGDQQISLDTDGNFSAIFSTQRRFVNNTSADYSRRYFVKLDPAGTILSSNTKEFNDKMEYPVAFEQINTGGYFFCGWHVSGIPSSSTSRNWSLGVNLDEEGNSITNEINGNLHWDENFDCTQQMEEQGFEGWIIEAQNNVLTYYDISDAEGNYSINTGTGSYDLRVIPPNEYWDICEGIVPVTFTETYDTLTQNFSAQALLDCPGMWVDISTWGLGNCFESTYTVNYCNNGTIDEEEAYIEVLIPEGLDLLEADIPYSELPNGILRFDVGAVGVNECGSFQFDVYVDCETVELGQTMCTEAHIYPDTLCMPGLMWSGASIEVTGECDADIVTYTIRNVGDAPTSQALEYFVVEDHVILMQGDFNLNPGEEQEVELPVTGATYRLEAEQEPNHPGFSMPSLAIEGCGGLTPGQVNLFSMDDNDDFIDIDCREVLASFDPNDKTGYPLGYDDENFIQESTQLEYVIRFQNTGTFTARRVVLRDTLSQFLDPTTVVAGSSSHPYTFEMIGDGVLKFTFDEIMLPDSATNESASQGFVKFKINQRTDNEIGTIINNTAAIYFDFNEPIITNETMHTVGEAFFTSLEYLVVGNDEISASVYPNPFGAVATIEIKEYDFTRGHFELFDITGRSVHMQEVDSPIFTFERNSLPAGTYAFTITLDETKAIVGKLVIL